jgi:pyruvate/2-oxoglutarate dehydrogenase complex dihydrolipoamide acyltransferase (E2) component
MEAADDQPVATLVRWYVPNGAKVEADQPVCEIETEQASADIAAPRAGILLRLQFEGDTIHPGDRIAEIS